MKKSVQRWLQYLGDTAPWLAQCVLLALWPFPRMYVFVAQHARVSRLVMERTFHIHSGPLAGFKLQNLLPDEIRPVLSNRMEIISCDVLTRLQLKSGVVLDVGGSYGYYALLLARLVGVNGHVYSFEPDWRSFARLINNLVLNCIQNVVPVPICLSDMPQGLAKWQSMHNEPWKSRLVDSVQAVDAHAVTAVPITTLDDFVSMLEITDKVNLVKVDVEGAEFKVLQGAKQLLLKSKPILLCELHSTEIAQKVFGLLSESGYQWEQIEYADETRQHILAFGHDQAEMCRDLIV